METAEYERMFRLENDYWWFVGRRQLVTSVLGDLYARSQELTILDIGCGTGAMSVAAGRWGKVVSADFNPLALGFTRKRNLNRLCAADASRLPFKDRSFDVILALDILEHVADDRAAVGEFTRLLKPGGRLIATVPAYRSLWSSHDVALQHHRRYVAGEVEDLFKNGTLRIERLSYAMSFLFPIVWAVRKLSPKRDGEESRASLVAVPRWANQALVALLRFENALVRRIRLPFGVTVFWTARSEQEVSPP